MTPHLLRHGRVRLYVCACGRACRCTGARTGVRAGVRVCVRAYVRVCVRARKFACGCTYGRTGCARACASACKIRPDCRTIWPCFQNTTSFFEIRPYFSGHAVCPPARISARAYVRCMSVHTSVCRPCVRAHVRTPVRRPCVRARVRTYVRTHRAITRTGLIHYMSMRLKSSQPLSVFFEGTLFRLA